MPRNDSSKLIFELTIEAVITQNASSFLWSSVGKMNPAKTSLLLSHAVADSCKPFETGILFFIGDLLVYLLLETHHVDVSTVFTYRMTDIARFSEQSD
jgi:hypothetical protein